MIGASPGLGVTLRILFESENPNFELFEGATNRAAMDRQDGVEFLWVRE